MIYLTSSFSMQMIKRYPLSMEVNEIDKKTFIEGLRYGFYGAVGHEPTASMMTNDLGMLIAFNRVRVTVSPGDTLFIWQYAGGRLPEGATVLPDGAEIRYLRVEFF
jgi:hypothetical protein